MTRIPFFALDRQMARYREDFLAIADRVWSRGQVLQGVEIAEFEAKVAARCGRRHGVAVASCTDALAFALIAAGIGPGDGVLVTAFSFPASAMAILRVGARPIFIDISPDDYMMDLASITSVPASAKAMIAVHLFGRLLPMAEVEAFAQRHGLALIEDAAQAFGATDGMRAAGSMGLASCLSFDPTKVVGNFGTAGMLLTDDADLAAKVRMLRYHGRDSATRHYEIVGYNSQMHTLDAALLSYKVDRMDEWRVQRSRIAEIYRDGLSSIAAIGLPSPGADGCHIWHKFVLRAADRAELGASLANDAIDSMIHYARPMCDEAVFASAPCLGDMSAARSAATSVLSLPMFPELTDEEAKRIVTSISRHYGA